jgi:hypothetical protein
VWTSFRKASDLFDLAYSDDTTGMIITVDPWDALVDEVSNDWTG